LLSSDFRLLNVGILLWSRIDGSILHAINRNIETLCLIHLDCDILTPKNIELGFISDRWHVNLLILLTLFSHVHLDFVDLHELELLVQIHLEELLVHFSSVDVQLVLQGFLLNVIERWRTSAEEVVNDDLVFVALKVHELEEFTVKFELEIVASSQIDGVQVRIGVELHIGPFTAEILCDIGITEICGHRFEWNLDAQARSQFVLILLLLEPFSFSESCNVLSFGSVNCQVFIESHDVIKLFLILVEALLNIVGVVKVQALIHLIWERDSTKRIGGVSKAFVFESFTVIELRFVICNVSVTQGSGQGQAELWSLRLSKVLHTVEVSFGIFDNSTCCLRILTRLNVFSR
jgi:hypothetical protein